MKQRIGVVGAGLAGLSAALRLAKKGHEVVVFEKNPNPGGKAGLWQEGGFSFDTGPSLLTMKFILEQLFEELELDLVDHLDLIELPILAKYFYPDGLEISAYADPEEFAGEVALKTDDSAESVKRFLDYTNNLYDLSADLFLLNEFRYSKILTPQFIQALLQIGQIRPWSSMARMIDERFQDPATRSIFYRYATYNGSSPFLAPSFFNIIAYVEHCLGAYLPRGGIYELPRKLTDIGRELGVEFRFGSLVEQLISKNGKICEVLVNDESEKLDSVIYAGDYWNLGKLTSPARVASTPFKGGIWGASSKAEGKFKKRLSHFSTSAILFYWGVQGDHHNLDLHNILFSADYAQEFQEIFASQVPSDPTIYINISSKFLFDAAPRGSENWFVMVNTPPDDGRDWQQVAVDLKARTISKIKNVLGIDLSDRIVVEKVVTPVDLAQDSGAYLGSLYGLNSNSLSQILRPRSKIPGFKNLFVAGGTVYPGGGMPLAILSGKFAADRILE